MDFSNNIDGWNETTYSATTVAASNSITLNPTFTVPSGSAFSAVITSATGYLQTVDYRYNIRGQLLSINNSKLANDGGITNSDNNDLFGMAFSYNLPDANVGNTPSYDGKLTAVKWMASDGIGYERSYKFAYDGVNRYTGEIYAERTAGSTGSFSNNVDGFDESGITYDTGGGGNIVTLNRNSSTEGTNTHIQIDNLTYGYNPANPNQLLTVTDGTGANYTGAGFRNLTGAGTGSTYVYDGNGNLTTDPYKGLSIGYDVLNRTDKITVTTATNRYINYIYDAGGNLIRKQAYDNNVLQTTTDYIDGFVYVNTTLSYFPMPEGRAVNNSGTLVQEFVITDQQGNARVSFQNNGSAPVIKQENSYYGFGLVLLNSPVATPTIPNKQLYNGGSEWQNDFSNLPDYYQTFNRNYDAAIARFVGVDPAAEGAESMTTYQYAGNNPIMLNDPLGDLADAVVNGVYQQYNATNDFNDWLSSSGGGSGSGGSGDYRKFWTGFYNAPEGTSFTDYKDQYDQNNGNFSYGVDMHGNIQYMVPFHINAYTLLGYSDPNSPNFLDVGIDIDQARFDAIIEQNGGMPPADDANSGGAVLKDASQDVDSRTVGHNIFGSNFIGPWNPKDNSGNWSYKPAAVNIMDIQARDHDQSYDYAHTSGFSGVLFSTATINADYTLVANSLDIAINGYGNFSPMERVEGAAVGLAIGIGALPKTVIYGAGQVLQSAVRDIPGYQNFKW